MNRFHSLALALGAALCSLAPTLAMADANLVANGSFEDVPFAMSGYDGSYCYEGSGVYTCGAALPAWSGAFPVMASTSGAWTATPDSASDLFQIGLQNTSAIEQTITLASAGQYTLSWSDAGRTSYGDEAYQVSFGGTVLAALVTLGGQGWSRHSVTFDAAAGGQTLSFAGLNTSGDSTAFIDNLSLTAAAVPEPATWALMLGGLLGVAFIARRRSD